MSVQAVSTIQPNKKSFPHAVISAAVGGGAGIAARSFMPTKDEFTNLSSQVSVAARQESRSILKYGGIGALAALALHGLCKLFAADKPEKDTNVEYTKLGALLDAPDYACEIMLFG